jgi:hypothetical protein
MSCSRLSRPAALVILGLALAVLAVSCNGGNGEPEDFAKFAEQVAEAAASGNVEFFTSRVQGTPHTCTAEEVEASTGPDAPPNPICLEEGMTFDQVYIFNYGRPANATTEDDLISDLNLYFQDALPEEQDVYGPGSVQLYATATPIESPTEGEVQTALLTAIHDRNNTIGRTVRGIDFVFVDGRWVIPGETAASFPTAVDLLEPSSAVLLYEDWALYNSE